LYLRAGNDFNYSGGICSFNGHGGSIGDDMAGAVGSELQIKGTSGPYYYTVLYDNNYSASCSRAYPTTQVHTEYYADAILERPQTNFFPIKSTHLPKFTEVTFVAFGMGTGSSDFGVYPNYENGYGMGIYMNYTSVHLTTTSAMTQYKHGNYANFDETWDSSDGT
jgi:hypothetical protein